MTILITIILTSFFWGLVLFRQGVKKEKELHTLGSRLFGLQALHSKEMQELKQTIYFLNEELLESKKLNVSRLVFDTAPTFPPYMEWVGKPSSNLSLTLSHNTELYSPGKLK